MSEKYKNLCESIKIIDTFRNNWNNSGAATLFFCGNCAILLLGATCPTPIVGVGVAPLLYNKLPFGAWLFKNEWKI